MTNKFNQSFEFDTHYTQKFLANDQFDPIELIHWSFMGDKFFSEVEHILKCHPSYINEENRYGDNALTISSMNCSSKVFHFLLNFPGINLKKKTELGDIPETFLFSTTHEESLAPTYDAEIEGSHYVPNYTQGSYDICLSLSQQPLFKEFYKRVDENGNSLITRFLESKPSPLLKDKIKGLLLFILKNDRDFFSYIDQNGNNIAMLLCKQNYDDILLFLSENGATEIIVSMLKHTNKNNENAFFLLFANSNMKNAILNTTSINTFNILPFFNYAALDTIEQFLDFDPSLQLELTKTIDGKNILNYLTEYQQVFIDISESNYAHLYPQEHIDFLQHYFKYTIRFFNKYIQQK